MSTSQLGALRTSASEPLESESRALDWTVALAGGDGLRLSQYVERRFGRATEPQLLDIMDSLVPLIGTEDEADAIEYIYRAFLPVSFSRDVLERAPRGLAALALDGVEWSDWGRPERIETVLALRRSRTLIAERACAP